MFVVNRDIRQIPILIREHYQGGEFFFSTILIL